MDRVFSYLTLFLLFVSPSSARWVLNPEDDYTPANFWNKFDFWNGPDPTHGHVNYVDRATATKEKIIRRRNGGLYMGVDFTNQAPDGRMSVRLESKRKYNTGSLMILDLAHMPFGCGTWPAFWTYGPNWPAGGEIDIIEGVHNQDHNAMTLHTTQGCTLKENPRMTGFIATANCWIDAPGQWSNQGCSIAATSQPNTYGAGFNAVKGGVYAMAWQQAQIRVWFFPRGSIPANIRNSKPNPAGWGRPLSVFNGGCNIPQFFKDNTIVFDTTFCGDWAGSVWDQSGCKTAEFPTCQDFVTKSPASFKQAFWQINYLKVFTWSGATKPVGNSDPNTIQAAPAAEEVAPVVDTTTTTITEEVVAPAAPAAPAMNVVVGTDGTLQLSPGKKRNLEARQLGEAAAVGGATEVIVEPHVAALKPLIPPPSASLGRRQEAPAAVAAGEAVTVVVDPHVALLKPLIPPVRATGKTIVGLAELVQDDGQVGKRSGMRMLRRRGMAS